MNVSDPLAQAEIDRLTAENEALRSKVEQYRARSNCTCGLLTAIFTTRTEHEPRCREYVGPIKHQWVRTSYNATFGGVDLWCSCGGWFRRGGSAGHGDGTEEAEAICPKATQDWRGPKPESDS